MASIKISSLVSLSSISSDDFFPVVDSGSLTTYKVDIDTINDWMGVYGSASLAHTASLARTASYALTSSFLNYNGVNNGTSSNSLTSSFLVYNGNYNGTASNALTSSWAVNAITIAPSTNIGTGYANKITKWSGNSLLTTGSIYDTGDQITFGVTSNSHERRYWNTDAKYAFNGGDLYLTNSYNASTNPTYKSYCLGFSAGGSEYAKIYSEYLNSNGGVVIETGNINKGFFNLKTSGSGNDSNTYISFNAASPIFNSIHIITGSIKLSGDIQTYDSSGNSGKQRFYGTASNALTASYVINPNVMVGTIIDFAGAVENIGLVYPNDVGKWLLCDGRLVSKTTYPELFLMIGYSWDTTQTGDDFALPNLGNRVTVGFSGSTAPILSSFDSNNTGSYNNITASTVSLTSDQIANHTHDKLGIDPNGYTTFTASLNGVNPSYYPATASLGFVLSSYQQAINPFTNLTNYNTSSLGTIYTIQDVSDISTDNMYRNLFLNTPSAFQIQNAGTGVRGIVINHDISASIGNFNVNAENTGHNNIPPAAIVNKIIRVKP